MVCALSWHVCKFPCKPAQHIHHKALFLHLILNVMADQHWPPEEEQTRLRG